LTTIIPSAKKFSWGGGEGSKWLLIKEKENKEGAKLVDLNLFSEGGAGGEKEKRWRR